jgi:hypothetical protein
VSSGCSVLLGKREVQGEGTGAAAKVERGRGGSGHCETTVGTHMRGVDGRRWCGWWLVMNLHMRSVTMGATFVSSMLDAAACGAHDRLFRSWFFGGRVEARSGRLGEKRGSWLSRTPNPRLARPRLRNS